MGSCRGPQARPHIVDFRQRAEAEAPHTSVLIISPEFLRGGGVAKLPESSLTSPLGGGPSGLRLSFITCLPAVVVRAMVDSPSLQYASRFLLLSIALRPSIALPRS